MNMQKKRTKALALLLIAILLWGCAPSQAQAPHEIVQALCQDLTLPAGRLFNSEASEWDETHMPPALCATLFDRFAENNYESCIVSCAFFLSTGFDAVSEIDVFLCHSVGDAKEIAAMCQSRIRRMSQKEYEVNTDCYKTAFVGIYGKTVVLCAVEDAERAKKILKELF